MLAAIDFHDQLSLAAAEVHDEIADWELPAKSESVKLSAPQPRPQLCLRLGLIVPQSASAIVSSDFIRNCVLDLRLPSPALAMLARPLPGQGEVLGAIA